MDPYNCAPAHPVDLLSRRNEMTPVVDLLPPELLSSIFEFACRPQKLSTGTGADSEGKSPQHPLRLGAVSFYWRQIVWSTPRLWNKISPFPPKESPRSGDLVSVDKDIVATYCRNSKSLPIDLNLDFRGFSSNTPFEEIRDVCKALLTSLAREARKIRSFICAADGANNHRVWSLLTTDLTIGEALYNLADAQFSESAPLFTHFPENLDVPLPNYSLSLSGSIWGLLTSLELDSLYTTQCLMILVQCTSLVEFKAFSRSTGPTVTLIPPEEVVTLERLQGWSSDILVNEPIYSFIYSSLRLPALNVLQLGGTSDPVPSANYEIADWKEFFETMSSLKEIRSSYWDCRVENWTKIWNIVGPSVEELDMSFAKSSQSLAFINLMTPSFLPLSNAQLPNMKTLHVSLCLNSDRMSRFLDMVELRKGDLLRENGEAAASFEKVVLRLCDHRESYGPEGSCREFLEDHRTRLEQLVSDGLTFEIRGWSKAGKEWVPFQW